MKRAVTETNQKLGKMISIARAMGFRNVGESPVDSGAETRKTKFIQAKQQTYYNYDKNGNPFKDYSVPTHFADEILSKHEKESSFYDPKNILWRSRHGVFDNYGLRHPLTRVWMSDFLMFNPNYQLDDIMDVERCLGYCFHQAIDERTLIIDQWKIGYNNQDHSRMVSLDFLPDQTHLAEALPKKDQDKSVIARGLLAIMNTVYPNHLNFANYYEIGEWYTRNESPIHLQEVSEGNFDYYQKTEEKGLPSTELKLDSVLTLEYVQKRVDSMIESSYDFNLCNPPKVDYPTFKVEVKVKINDQEIINLKDLDKILGTINLKYLVQNLKHYQDSNIYCDVPAELLLMEMYNSQGPTGFGALQYKSNAMTPDEAKKIFEKADSDKYFDYLNGVRLKLNFHYYPFLDIDRYDEHYGAGSAQKCLDNARNGNFSNRSVELN